MEENLKELLKAENDVNKKVQDALNKKYINDNITIIETRC